MKKILIITIIFLSSNLFSQNVKNFFITKEGEKITVYKNIHKKTYEKRKHEFKSDYALTGMSFFYHDKNGDLQRTLQSKIKEAFLFGRHYINKKIGSILGFNRLHEVIIENERYILTQYYEAGFYCYLTDKTKDKFVFKKIKVSKNYKKDRRFIEKKIKPYFKNCKDFMHMIYLNTKFKYRYKNLIIMNDNLFEDVPSSKCN
jgi:hypothetical protein